MRTHALKILTIIFISSTLTGCWGWTDARKKTIKNKCQSEKYDCDCFLKVTLDMFEAPEDYNNASDEELAKYEERLNSECKIPEDEKAADEGWKDEDIEAVLSRCPEGYDCDCYMSRVMETFPNKETYIDVVDNADESNEEFKQFEGKTLISCKL